MAHLFFADLVTFDGFLATGNDRIAIRDQPRLPRNLFITLTDLCA